jgi:phosphatidylglycerol:prolipoprotein diacylglycerol transferase
MHPILFEIGGFPVYTYGVLLAAAYLLGLQFALWRAKSRGLDPNRVMDLGIWIIVSALVGAEVPPALVALTRYVWFEAASRSTSS